MHSKTEWHELSIFAQITLDTPCGAWDPTWVATAGDGIAGAAVVVPAKMRAWQLGWWPGISTMLARNVTDLHKHSQNNDNNNNDNNKTIITIILIMYIYISLQHPQSTCIYIYIKPVSSSMDGWQTSSDSQIIPSVFALIVSSLVPSLQLPTVSTWSWNGLSRDSPFQRAKSEPWMDSQTCETSEKEKVVVSFCGAPKNIYNSVEPKNMSSKSYRDCNQPNYPAWNHTPIIKNNS